jgi:Ni,Fe-hydrogenase I cytochrome b subunit
MACAAHILDTDGNPVKVWQPWIRTLHWTLVATVVARSLTGFYIGNPVLDAGPRWSLMSLTRTTHPIASWVFIAVQIGRGFLAFTANPWASWDQLVPWRTWFPGAPSVAGPALMATRATATAGRPPSPAGSADGSRSPRDGSGATC